MMNSAPGRRQWRRQDFVRGGERPGQLKAITRSRRGSGGEGLPDGREFHFLKGFKLLENESIFQ